MVGMTAVKLRIRPTLIVAEVQAFRASRSTRRYGCHTKSAFCNLVGRCPVMFSQPQDSDEYLRLPKFNGVFHLYLHKPDVYVCPPLFRFTRGGCNTAHDVRQQAKRGSTLDNTPC